VKHCEGKARGNTGLFGFRGQSSRRDFAPVRYRLRRRQRRAPAADMSVFTAKEYFGGRGILAS
jgi:hypothetical protein